MMRGAFAWMLRSCNPVLELGLTSFGWLKKLKKSAVSRMSRRSAGRKCLAAASGVGRAGPGKPKTPPKTLFSAHERVKRPERLS
jgi:hypothetical protein